MATRLLRRPALQSTVLFSAITTFFYHSRNQQPLLSDSASKEQWPESRQPRPIQKELGITRTTKSAKELYLAQEDGVAKPKNEDPSAWDSFTSSFSSIGNSISSISWSSMGDNITDFIVPDWAKVLPGYVTKLQAELDMAPGSLADEIWQESQDPYINPEILRQATVRISKDLCNEELEFRTQRKRHTSKALAKYLGIREEDVHPDDVPTIAMCASGGGLRALTAGTSSYLSAQEDGLFDCVTYTAGVSGSCWLQALYNSSIGETSHERIIKHLKKRIGTHIAFPPTALGLMISAPTNKFLLSGFVEKLMASSTTAFGLVDVYGLLLGARLLVPHGDLEVEDKDLKLSNQRAYIDSGLNPMPIYTAVRHELPLDEDLSDATDKSPSIPDKMKEQAAAESWFQWFEFTPYEFFCEELDAGIPIWSLGRRFQNGRSILRQDSSSYLPEIRVPLLMGIWGSAFCATLSHYYKEVRPLLKGLVGFSGMDDILEERNDDLIKVHPITPSSIPSFTLGLEDKLPKICPKSIFSAKNLQLMDAGMSNNLPIYPLLRPGRNVDILIAFDASADIKTENWLSVADGYAKQRGIMGWPVGAGWPKADTAREAANLELEAASSASAQEAASKVAAEREKQREECKNSSSGSTKTNQAKHPDRSQDLSYCTIWLGNTQERTSHDEPPPSKRVNPDDDWELLAPNAGIAVVYFPFIPNPNVEGVDPNTSDFMSTWNFIYTPEEIEKVVSLARANYAEGKEMTRRCVRAVYERRKAERMRREEEWERRLWWRRLREGGDHFR